MNKKIVFDKTVVNASKVKEQLISIELALKFMLREVLCIKYRYLYFPNFVL